MTPHPARYTRATVFLGLLAALGFVGGCFSGLLGIGGGIVMVPLLLFVPPVLGFPALDMRQVAGMTLVQVFVAALLGYLVHRRGRGTARDVVLWMGTSMVVGTSAGSLASGYVELAVLEGVFVALALMAAPVLFLDPPAGEVDDAVPRAFSRGLAAGSALAIGFLSGLVGIGGAFLAIPVMIYGLGVPTRVAIGSSLGVLTLAALAGALAKLGSGQAPLLWTALLCAGTVPGSWAGAHVSRRVPARGLRLSLAVLVVLTALRMLFGLRAAWQVAR